MPRFKIGLMTGLSCFLIYNTAHSTEISSGPERLREAQTEFRVCGTPGSLSFTNENGNGFDNKIAEAIASEEGKPLSYAWAEPGHAFVRQTLGAWKCDTIMSVPAGFGPVATTKPYYCSKYVELRRKSSASAEADRIGVVVKTPPLDILLHQHRDPQVYLPNDPNGPDYIGRIGSDLVSGRIGAAYVWGPLAAKFVREAPDKLEITSKNIASSDPDIRTAFPMAMGVRHGDGARLDRLNAFITKDHAEIKHILESYGVPLAEGPQCAPPAHEASVTPPARGATPVAAPAVPLSRYIVKVADAPATQNSEKIQCKNPETLQDIANIPDNTPKDAPPPYDVKDGKLGPKAYQGWIRFSLNCQMCHGPGGVGSAIAPDLTQAIKGLNEAQFDTILHCGLKGNIGVGVMPAWANNPNVMPYEDDLWAYLKARADGKVGAGRPEQIASASR